MLPDDILNLCLHVPCPSLHISSLSIDEDFKRVLFWHERWEVASSLVQHVQQRLLLLPSQVIHPSPDPAGMTFFLAVSLPPDSCPDKTGEFQSVPIGSRKVRLETDWKITGIVRKHPTGIRRQRTSQKRLGNGRKRRKPAESDTEIAETGRLFEVPATGLIDLGLHSILHWQGRIAVLSYQAIGRIRKEGRSSSPANITEYFVNSQFVSGFHCLRWITIDHYHLMSLFIFDHLIHLCAESLTRPFTGIFGWRRVGRGTGKNLLCDSLCNGCDWEKKKSLIFLLWQENIRSSLVRWNLFHLKHF